MRSRSITIYAQSKEEYSNMLDEDDKRYFSKKRIRPRSKAFCDEEDSLYSSLEGLSLGNQIISSEEEDISSSSSQEEQLITEINDLRKHSSHCQNEGIELLCLYLKNSINSDNDSKEEGIFYKNKNSVHTLSGNAIYDISIRELVDNIITDNENDFNSTKSTFGNSINQNSLRGFIIQNIPQEDKVKVMIISNNTVMKTNLIKLYFQNKNLSTSSFEIRHKVIVLFGKTISIEIFDTEGKFHCDPTSQVYFKITDAFVVLIDASQPNTLSFLEDIINRINLYSESKNSILIAYNLFFNPNCTIDDVNLKEFASLKGMIYIQKEDLKPSTETSYRHTLNNLISLVLMTKVDKAIDVNTKKKQIEQPLIPVVNTLGYKKEYRLRYWNAFDLNDNCTNNKLKRRWSADV